MGIIQKDLESLLFRQHRKIQRGSVLRAVPDEESLRKKINNRDVYVDYGATKDIPEQRSSQNLKQVP